MSTKEGEEQPFETAEVVVVGAGMAGLSAAYALKDRKCVVLEAAARVGGRVFSQPSGQYWLNFGAHMFGEPHTPLGRLVAELGLESRPIVGRLLGMAYCGKRLLNSRPEIYPIHLPVSVKDRLSFVRMGLALRLGSHRLARHSRSIAAATAEERRQRMLSFEDWRTLKEFVGQLTPEMGSFLTAFTERSGGDPADMSAGHGLRSFGNVWSKTAPGRNIVGGSALVPVSLAQRIGSRLRLQHKVLRIEQAASHVVVEYRADGQLRKLVAKAVIVATPSFVAREIIQDLPPATDAALQSIRYGAFVTAAVLTQEAGSMPWDRNYAISTPKRSFSVLFNMATTLRAGPRRAGGSIMLFRGAAGAEEMMGYSDEYIERRFFEDLVAEFPEARGLVEQIVVQRWNAGAPYGRPGRAGIQSALTACLGRVFLAGDYLEFPNMEAAVATGHEAASQVRLLITSDTQPPKGDRIATIVR